MGDLERRSKRSGLEAEINALKQSVVEADSDLKAALEQVKEREQETVALKEEIEKEQQGFRSATEAEQAAKSQIAVLKSELDRKATEIGDLRQDLAEQGLLSNVVSRQKTEISSLTESLSSAQQKQETNQHKLETADQQLKEAFEEIEKSKLAIAEVNQKYQMAENGLRSLKEEKSALERLVERLKSDADQAEVELRSAKAEHHSDDAKMLIEKNEMLSKQIGHLESASQYSQAAKEELKEIISAQKQRIGELEESLNSANEMATRQSEAAVASNAALQKIEAALGDQTNRMSAMEEVNRQSLVKIAELQSAAAKRSSSGSKSKSSARSGSQTKKSKNKGQLSEINGIGPKYQKRLISLGVEKIQEIAQWSDADVKEFAGKLGCGEKVTQDWRERAKELVKD